MSETQSILVIEDDAEDYRFLKRIVSKADGFQIACSSTLSSGLAHLANNSINLILLDLTLPDSKGIEIISSLSNDHDIPIVVLTGLDNESMAYSAVQLGAQDYLVKGTFDSVLLLKTMRYAIERYRLVYELSESKLAVLREQEQKRLRTTIPLPNPSVTAKSYGQYSLKDSSPDKFAYFTSQYKTILESSLEERAFKVDNDISEKRRVLATQLGRQRAVPRDVIELHTQVIASLTSTASKGKSAAFHEEGRYLLVGVLGHLCTFYRAYCYTLLPAPSGELNDVDSMDTIQEMSEK